MPMESQISDMKKLKMQSVRISWDAGMISLLGTMTDAELARRLGIPLYVVIYKRLSLGIPSFKNMKVREWKRNELGLLGKKSDEEVAKLLGMAKTTISNKRKSLGIEAFAFRSKLWRSWTQEEVEMLGKDTDKEVARRLKIHEVTVALKRRQLGIASFYPRLPNKNPRREAVDWSRKNLALLGKLPDERVAEIIRISRKSVLGKRKRLGIESFAVGTQFWHPWTEEEIARLGKTTDRELAEQLGIQPMCVTAKRRQMGIESFAKASGLKTSRVWTEREIALLGTKPDAEVARELGLGVGVVWKKRNQLGMPTDSSSMRSPVKWTPEVLTRLGKEPLQKIAEDIGVTREAVRQKCVKLGITARFGRK